MKLLLTASFVFGLSQAVAAPAPLETSSRLLSSGQRVEVPVADGSCSDSVACPDGVHTAYCQATGPYTRCHRWGDYGVRCVAWNNAGKSTVAAQSCPGT